MQRFRLETAEIDGELLEFMGIREENEYVEFIKNSVSEVSRKLGLFYWTERKTYCCVSNENQNEHIDEIPEKIAQKRVAQAIGQGIIKSFGKEEDSLKDKMAEFKKDVCAIEEAKFVFEPHEPPILRTKKGVFQINSFSKTDIMERVHKERDAGLRIDSFEFLAKCPHIDALLQNLCTDQGRKEYFLNWLAFAAVTLKKTGTAMIFKGSPGTGKGVLFNCLLRPFFGKDFCPELSNDDMSSSFTNPALSRALMVGFNEVKGSFAENNTMYERLKLLVTEDIFRYTLKGKDSSIRSNNFNCLFFSNNAVPIQIQYGDRRYSVFSTSSRPLKEVARASFNENMNEFIAGIAEELEFFWKNLALYDFSELRAKEIYHTREREGIQNVTDTKQNILAVSLVSLNKSFQNEIAEKISTIFENGAIDNPMLSKLCEKAKIKTEGTKEEITKSLEFFFDTFNKFIENYGVCPVTDLSLIVRLYLLDETDFKGGGLISEQKFVNLVYNSGSFVRLQKRIAGTNAKCVTCREWAEAYVPDKTDSVWEALK